MFIIWNGRLIEQSIHKLKSTKPDGNWYLRVDKNTDEK
jgi:hypothetical protein